MAQRPSPSEMKRTEQALEGSRYSSSCLCVYTPLPPPPPFEWFIIPQPKRSAFETGFGPITQRDPQWPRKWEKAWQNKWFPENLNLRCFSVGLRERDPSKTDLNLWLSDYYYDIIWKMEPRGGRMSHPVLSQRIREDLESRWYGNFNVSVLGRAWTIQHQKIGNWRLGCHWTAVTYSEYPVSR